MTRIERCVDPKCRGYGKELVDRGYGYPICPSNRPNLNPVPMNPKYYGQYRVENKSKIHYSKGKKIHRTDQRGFKTLCGLKVIHNMGIVFDSSQVTCKRCKKAIDTDYPRPEICGCGHLKTTHEGNHCTAGFCGCEKYRKIKLYKRNIEKSNYTRERRYPNNY